MLDRYYKSVIMANYVVIKQDLYDIAKRLKEIDRNYFAVYNFRLHRYEVHHSGQKHTFCLAVPYEVLDERTLRLVRQTRSERAREFAVEMERENVKKERQIKYQIKKQAEKALEEAL